MKIGEVARQVGLRSSTLRYYEQIGLLPEPPRRSGQRAYDDDVFSQLKIIKAAQRAGFSLDEIREMLHAYADGTPASARWHSLAHQKLAEIDAAIEAFIAMKHVIMQGLECECVGFDDCVLLAE